MKIASTFNYRNALEIIQARHQNEYQEILDILNDPNFQLVENADANNNFSRQIQNRFRGLNNNWDLEFPCYTANELAYDLHKNGLPIEVEIGHQRLVYADFFKFLSDYSRGRIHAAIMIVTDNPLSFGHNWHCSVDSTQRKIASISQIYLVPTLLIGINR